MKHVFIINGQAKPEYKQSLDLHIRSLFKDHDYVIEYTQYPRHATKIVSEYAKNYTDLRIYACGGDGTIHEVVNGIYPHTHVQLAIVPIGTGNDFVRSFGYERQDFKSLENYLNPTYLMSDIIKVSDQNGFEIAINTVSLGFDVRIAENMPKFKKKAGAANAYYLSMIYCLKDGINEMFQLEVDHQRIPSRKYMFIVACNGNYYGGGFKPCPQANIADGYLDLCFVHDVPLYRIPDLSIAYKKGEHLKYKKYTSNRKIKKLKVLNPGPTQINLDGEIRTMICPIVEIVPSQIKICLPKKKVNTSLSKK